MKIIIQNGVIAGTVTDAYEGPEITVLMPEGFDFNRADEYHLVDGEVVKLHRWNFIKVIRDQKVQSGGYKVVVAGVDKWFHSDTFSRTQQMGLVMLGANCPSVPWKTMDGSYVTMTPTLAQQIFAAAAAQDQVLFMHAEALRASTETDFTDIDAGWPGSYGEA